MRAVVIHGGGKALAFVRDLLADGIETYVLHGKSPVFATGYPGVRPGFRESLRRDRLDSQYPDPVTRPEEYRRFVLEQLELIRPEIVIPANAAEITALYPARGEIEAAGIVFPFGEEETYQSLRDKSKLHELFPEYVADTKVLEGHWYQKPCLQTSSKGVRRVGVDGKWVLQREFVGYGVGYETLVDKGEVKYRFMHRRRREIPASGGASTARVSYWHEGIAAAAEDILRRAGWTGFAMLEFRQNEQGDFTLIEINPRPWGSIQLAIDSGVRFPSFAYRYFVRGEQIPCPPPRADGEVETRIVPYDILTGIQYLGRGDGRNFLDALSVWKDFHWEIFRPLDRRHLLVNPLFLYDGTKEFLKSLASKIRPGRRS
jgi:hypothetical protein